MTEEPYRWLEAIANRREYIREQMKGGTPVFALSRPEGILLLGVGIGRSKVFEIYDRHGLAALGHPVDIERLRQAAIESAHVEGFNRSSRDVTLRRLIGFSLSPMLKQGFEQIFSPPFIVESVWAELGATPAEDVLVRVHHDGNHSYERGGLVVAHGDPRVESETTAWLRERVTPDLSLAACAGLCLVAWRALAEGRSLGSVTVSGTPDLTVPGRVVEAALLDRALPGPVRYRELTLS